MSFGELLKQTRLNKGFTQAEMAKMFGWTPMYYGRYENGCLLPTKKNYKRFADFLGLSLEDFIRLVETKN